jgi:hypothetical protein
MLSDPGHQDGIALREAGDGLDHRLGLDVLGLEIRLGHLEAPVGNAGHPFRVSGALAGGEAIFEEGLEVRGQGQIGADALVQFGGVYIHMGDALALGKVLDRHAIIEAAPQGQDQVRLAEGIVRRDGPVHARHAEIVGAMEGDGPQGVEGGGDRHVEALGEDLQGLGRAGMNDAAAHLDDRPLRLGQGIENGVRGLAVKGAGSR